MKLKKTLRLEKKRFVCVRTLTNKFHLNERNIRAFCDYLVNKKVPKNLTPPINTVDTITVSTSECERGFSQMNSTQRASLLVKTVSSLLVIKFNGPPLNIFDPLKYVDSWLLKNHHSLFTHTPINSMSKLE
ncbi:hypothetical protein RI129_000471 [Pyrocoelia pectoralis]|uniref:HAT C-terminal dimerisation domain-containing protein n=1 Tax=Pyrocoelia pectoralis TaxID=417401 RepID=A0AAN7ZQK0_9COLE